MNCVRDTSLLGRVICGYYRPPPQFLSPSRRSFVRNQFDPGLLFTRFIFAIMDVRGAFGLPARGRSRLAPKIENLTDPRDHTARARVIEQ